MAIRTLLSDLRRHYRFSPRNKARLANARRWACQLEALECRSLMAADVVTDKQDYMPAETAVISGTGYAIGETIELQVLHIDGTPNTGNGHEAWQVVDGGAGDLDGQANGNFQTTWYVDPDDSLGSTFELNASGLGSGLTASHTFTDASLGYSPSSTTLSVAPGGSVSFTQTIDGPFQISSYTVAPKVVGSLPAGVTVTADANSSSAGNQNMTIPAFGGTRSWIVTVSVAANVSGSFSFEFRGDPSASGVGEGTGTQVTVNVTNTPPVAVNNSYSTNEDTPLSISAPGILANDTDANGNSLTAGSFTNPAHGTLSAGANGSFLYTPNANFFGNDSFTYKANDGTANSNVATVSITVNPVNDAPVATNDSYTTNEDTPLVISLPGVLGNDTDVEGSALTVASYTAPAHGTLSVQPNGSFLYTPNANYFGSDSFTYKANDGTANSNVATVSITVNSVNDAPVAVNDSFVTDEDAPLIIGLPGILGNDTDVEGSALAVASYTAPAHGTLSVQPNGSFFYTPDNNFHGSDSFTYKVSDGTANSNVATVSITINPLNDAPIAVGDSYTTDEDTPLSIPAPGILANDSDIDGDSLIATNFILPQHGTLVPSLDGGFLYTPDADFHGTDSFSYQANDGQFESSRVTVSITVNPINDAPVAVDDNYVTDEDAPLIIPTPGVLGNDFDVDGDVITLVSYTDAAHGTLNLNADGSFFYTPDHDFNGVDSFTYFVTDGLLTSVLPATVTITINPVNDAPAATGESYDTDEDTPLVVIAPGILANDTDVDGDLLHAMNFTAPAHGTLAPDANGSFIYTPDADFHGVDSFSYQANDGQFESNLVTVSITVHSVNDAPVAVDDTYTTNEDAPLIIPAPGVLGNDIDVDGDSITLISYTDASHGTLNLNADGSFFYTPDHDFNGVDHFTYEITDGALNSLFSALVTITVSPLNDAPVAQGETYVTSEDTSLTIPALGVLANDFDIDGDALTATNFIQPAHGTLVGNADGSFTYTPNANFNGVDSFSYQANDGQFQSNRVKVKIIVSPTNDGPVANKDIYTTAEDTPLVIPAPGVLQNDTDIDGDQLFVIGVTTQPAHGKVTMLPNGSFIYTPDANFNGLDAFTYLISDSHEGISTAKVKITVTPGFDLSDYLVVAADAGSKSKPYVKVYDVVSGPTPVLIAKIQAYEDGYRDGVRIAIGDLTGDGIPEIITAPGRLHTPEVRVFKFFKNKELTEFRTLAYDAKFDKGLTVAVGDMNGDGRNDIITSPTLGNVTINVFQNQYGLAADAIKNTPMRSFKPFAKSFEGGATVAAADMNNDGKAEVIVGSGVGMRPTVLVFDTWANNTSPIRTFLPLQASLRGGIQVSAARVNDDAIADIVVAAAAGGKSQVEVLHGATGGILKSFTAYTDKSNNAPVRTALRDLNNDGIIDFIYTGQGPDGRTHAIRRFDLTSPTPIGVDALLELDENFAGGLFLG